MSKEADNRIICQGNWGSIEYAVISNGSMPAKKDLDSLEKPDARRINVLFMRFAQTGKLKKEEFKKLEGKIFEFKRHPYRVACFFIHKRCILTHVFDKKNSKSYVSAQISKAEKIMDDHLKCENKAIVRGL